MSEPAVHPEPEELADFEAGLAGGERARLLAAHVAVCARCQAVSARLTAVGETLSSAPLPVIPAPVHRRLTEALAAEAEARSAGLATVSALPAARRRLPPPATLMRVAAACVVLAGSGFLLSQIGSGRSTPPPGTAGPAASPQSPPRNGGDRVGESTNGPGGISQIPVSSTGTDFEPATLGRQVAAVIAAERASAHAGTTEPQAGKLGPASDGCVQRVTPGTRPVLVDVARYRGSPAIVIATSSRAWVVGTGCDAGHTDLITSVALPPGTTGMLVAP